MFWAWPTEGHGVFRVGERGLEHVQPSSRAPRGAEVSRTVSETQGGREAKRTFLNKPVLVSRQPHGAWLVRKAKWHLLLTKATTLLGEKTLRDAAWNVTRNGRQTRPPRRRVDSKIKREGGAGVTGNTGASRDSAI